MSDYLWTVEPPMLDHRSPFFVSSESFAKMYDDRPGFTVKGPYVATKALLSPAVNKAAGKALAKQLAESHESGSFADVYEEAAIVLQTAIRATIAGLGVTDA